MIWPLGASPRAHHATFACAALALFVITQLPLYVVAYPPITDLPAHLARLHTLIGLSGSEPLQRYYAPAFPLAPNLAMDLVVPLLARVFDLLFAFKLFVSIACLSLFAGTVTLGRALHGSLTPWSFGALIFMQNLFLHYGLINYLFGLGLALWALAWMLRTPWRLHRGTVIAGAGIALALYLVHLSALGVYLVGVAAALIARCVRAGRHGIRDLAQAALVTTLQLVPLLLIHALLAHPRGTFQPVPEEGVSWSLLAARKVALLLLAPAMSVGGELRLAVPICAVTCLLAGWLAWRKRLVFSYEGLWMSALLAVVMLVIPAAGYGTDGVAARLLLPVVLLAWVSVAVTAGTRREWVIGATLAGLVTALISGHAWISWLPGSAEHGALREAMLRLDTGSRVATVALQRSPLAYAGAWAIIDRSALLSNGYFRPFNAVWVGLKDEYAPLADLARTDDLKRPRAPFEQLCRHFDYVLLVGPQRSTHAYAPCAATVHASDGLRLVRARQGGDVQAQCGCAADRAVDRP